ncbi:hypothetical protein [Variovorax paradoxus]|uniref:hypothetical protein n=1 Tax=Variovorax paradoxus TaxID=34073 RepID=UPI0024784882
MPPACGNTPKAWRSPAASGCAGPPDRKSGGEGEGAAGLRERVGGGAVGREQQHLRAAERQREPSAGRRRQRRDRALEAPYLDGHATVEPVQRMSGRDPQHAVGHREVVDVGELGHHLGVVERAVGLEHAIHHRHRDGGAAAPEQAVGETAKGVEHQAVLQRRSYCTKSGSAPSSL